MKLFNNLPLYEAVIANDECGVNKVSCVTNPATEVNWVAFDEDEKIVKFAVDDKVERMITGVLMLASTPIYRRTSDNYEYYIVYSKETLKVMAEKMIFDGVGSNVNIQHQDGTDVDGVNLVELYIIDREKGIAPTAFESVPDGSLMVTYKVHNDALWDMIEKGEVLSFSLEGVFAIAETFANQESNNNKEKENKLMTKLSKIKQVLKSLLIEFGEVSTDKGVIVFDGDELEAGMSVNGIDAEGNEVELADGEYRTEDKKIIVVKDGKVEEIKDDEAEVATDEPAAEEPAEEMADDYQAVEPAEEPSNDEPEEDEKDKLIEELKARIAELEAENAELKAKVEELSNEPAAPSAEEAFEAIDEKKGNTKADELKSRGYKW